jgi:hypothetical protein
MCSAAVQPANLGRLSDAFVTGQGRAKVHLVLMNGMRRILHRHTIDTKRAHGRKSSDPNKKNWGPLLTPVARSVRANNSWPSLEDEHSFTLLRCSDAFVSAYSLLLPIFTNPFDGVVSA